MRHVGDITKLHGWELEPVDVVTGGSPCQDLSVAGKRAGLDGERSGLFMEQIRVVKEMRERDRQQGIPAYLCRPRFVVWENVPGAFSSNKGKDFQAVLTEFVRIAEPTAPDVPLPDKGRWSKSGCITGVAENGVPFSVAYVLHDAQYWGVPQRRKRLALCADFCGFSAFDIIFKPAVWGDAGRTDAYQAAGSAADRRGTEILSVEPRMSGHPHQGREKGQGTAGTAEEGSDESDGI